MAVSAPRLHLLHRRPHLSRRQIPIFTFSSRRLTTFGMTGARNWILRSESIRNSLVISMCSATPQVEDVSVDVQKEEVVRPPFDLNLAVILAGFAFEAYYTPPENIGKYEMDAGGCRTIFLSESFLRNIYDGQLFVKLKRGLNFPAMDPWGTSDPYVVLQYEGQVVKSNTKWGKREPTWNEEFTLNIKQHSEEYLQVAAWDANLVTPHKRMGNSGVSLEGLCDGNSHELLVELDGIGGGGKIELEVRYRTFAEVDKDKSWWRVPYFISDFLRKNGFEPALKMLVGSDTVQTREFVKYAFGQLKSFNDAYALKDKLPSILKPAMEDNNSDHPSRKLNESPKPEEFPERHQDNMSCNDAEDTEESQLTIAAPSDNSISVAALAGEAMKSGGHFWKSFAEVINQNVVKNLGVSGTENMRWDGFDLLDKFGLQFTSAAEAHYVESGLATPSNQENHDNKVAELQPNNSGSIQSNLQDAKKATEELLRQTDSIFGALMVLAASVQQPEKESDDLGKGYNKNGLSSEVSSKESEVIESNTLGGFDEKREEEMKALFSSAESAMEAWAMLATSLGHPSFIKSEFEKICFLDNSSTDTQVALWRDLARKRLVVSFRGTEQTKWKDLMTDLMVAPAGLNPERIGGDFKQEVQVHSGFLSAYDSVRTRIMSLIQKAVSYRDEDPKAQRWHVYVTGHSLGGALATLLALELSSSQLSKSGAVTVTMYNFGSPRVGNRKFAEVYNQKVKDSWRVVNHRDIIPTVPRLMGYCHVAQPVYLAPGMLQNALENMELLGDGYQGDVIGESTPDVIVSEFMKGEKELVEKLLQTEINIFRSIRDGSALMQHMEDFYYITLLENVRSRYQTFSVPGEEEDEASIA